MENKTLDELMNEQYLNLGEIIVMRLYSKIGKEHYLFFNHGDITHPILHLERSEMSKFKNWLEFKKK